MDEIYECCGSCEYLRVMGTGDTYMCDCDSKADKDNGVEITTLDDYCGYWKLKENNQSCQQ